MFASLAGIEDEINANNGVIVATYCNGGPPSTLADAVTYIQSTGLKGSYWSGARPSVWVGTFSSVHVVDAQTGILLVQNSGSIDPVLPAVIAANSD